MYSIFFQVFVDIMIHFARRGRENLRDLTRSHFAAAVDGSGTRYIYLGDEKTKNHQDDDGGAEGRMLMTVNVLKVVTTCYLFS